MSVNNFFVYSMINLGNSENEVIIPPTDQNLLQNIDGQVQQNNQVLAEVQQNNNQQNEIGDLLIQPQIIQQQGLQGQQQENEQALEAAEEPNEYIEESTLEPQISSENGGQNQSLNETILLNEQNNSLNEQNNVTLVQAQQQDDNYKEQVFDSSFSYNNQQQGIQGQQQELIADSSWPYNPNQISQEQNQASQKKVVLKQQVFKQQKDNEGNWVNIDNKKQNTSNVLIPIGNLPITYTKELQIREQNSERMNRGIAQFYGGIYGPYPQKRKFDQSEDERISKRTKYDEQQQVISQTETKKPETEMSYFKQAKAFVTHNKSFQYLFFTSLSLIIAIFLWKQKNKQTSSSITELDN